MPKQKNTLLRTLVPLLIIVVGAGLAFMAFRGGSGATPTPQPPTPAPAQPAAGQPQTQPSAQPPVAAPPTGAPTPSQPAPLPAQPTGPALSLATLRAQTLNGDPAAANFAPLGTIDPGQPEKLRVEFTPMGAGVRAVTLAEHFDTIRKESHTVVQRMHTYTPPPAADGSPSLPQVVAPMSLLFVEINGQAVNLVGGVEQEHGPMVGLPVWRQTAPGSFEATIVNEQEQPVARVWRQYSLSPNSYEIRVQQGLDNLSGQQMIVRWQQFGPVDMFADKVSYGGDRRRIRFGYLLKPNLQGNDPTVSSSEFRMDRSAALEPRDKPTGLFDGSPRELWPNPKSTRQEYKPVWVGVTNRYFGAAVHELFDPKAAPQEKVFDAAASVDRVVLQRFTEKNGRFEYDPALAIRTTSQQTQVAAGGKADFSMGYFAGPLARTEIKRDPLAAAAGLQGLVVYNFGGPCAFCTFGWLAGALLALLHLLHSAVFDWGVAIILLVLIVRSILHPVTRWSQIRMQRFGAQMQSMAPKQKKLQEKYGSDPQKLREEMAKLWREEGISPTGALGCIPMFLQSPVWFALSAVLFFAIELRHQPAFYGIVQSVVSGYPKFMGWFLGDLAEPDRFVYFGKAIFTLPFMGPIDSFNLLPLLLGVVFFLQQKYLTPPTTTPLTPEQEQQQKIMKVMMVVMFPLLMYNAPSGLSLYFLVNSTLGIFESRWIRAHINKHDLLKPVKKGPPKPGSFMERLQKLAEERQRQMMQGRGQQPPRKRV